MKNWIEKFEEKLSAGFRKRVLTSAERELSALAPEGAPWWSRRQSLAAFSSIALALTGWAGFRLYKRSQSDERLNMLTLESDDDQEMLEELDLLAEYDVILEWDESEGS